MMIYISEFIFAWKFSLMRMFVEAGVIYAAERHFKCAYYEIYIIASLQRLFVTSLRKKYRGNGFIAEFVSASAD